MDIDSMMLVVSRNFVIWLGMTGMYIAARSITRDVDAKPVNREPRWYIAFRPAEAIIGAAGGLAFLLVAGGANTDSPNADSSMSTGLKWYVITFISLAVPGIAGMIAERRSSPLKPLPPDIQQEREKEPHTHQ